MTLTHQFNSLIDNLKATRDPLSSLIHPYTVLVH